MADLITKQIMITPSPIAINKEASFSNTATETTRYDPKLMSYTDYAEQILNVFHIL